MLFFHSKINASSFDMKTFFLIERSSTAQEVLLLINFCLQCAARIFPSPPQSYFIRYLFLTVIVNWHDCVQKCGKIISSNQCEMK